MADDVQTSDDILHALVTRVEEAAKGVSGSGSSGRGGVLGVVGATLRAMGKSPGFMAFAFFCVAALVYTARVNHEPIATAVAGVAVAVFGAGAWKNHSDQMAAK